MEDPIKQMLDQHMASRLSAAELDRAAVYVCHNFPDCWAESDTRKRTEGNGCPCPDFHHPVSVCFRSSLSSSNVPRIGCVAMIIVDRTSVENSPIDATGCHCRCCLLQGVPVNVSEWVKITA